MESELQRRVIDYWDQRARGYSLATRLSLRRSTDMMERISRIVDLTGRMRVADMGCGAGLMSIIFSRLGHDVTGIDMSESMIRLAKRNAKDLGLHVDFVRADVQDPPLPDASCDMIVAKSTIWCTVDPVGTYGRWMDILRPGGTLLIVDGNHYLDLFDEEYRRRKEYFDLKNGVDNNLHAKTNIDGVDLNIIRELSRELPLTRQRRPSWDVATLLGLGMTDIRVVSTDSQPYSVLNENGLMKLPSSFILTARKPWEDCDDQDEGPWRLPGDASLDHVRDSLKERWTAQQAVLKAMSNDTRLDIVHALMSGRMSVSQILSVVGGSQSMISHSLRVLREAGVVEATRDGKEIVYGLTDVHVVRAIVNLCGLFYQLAEADVGHLPSDRHRDDHKNRFSAVCGIGRNHDRTSFGRLVDHGPIIGRQEEPRV